MFSNSLLSLISISQWVLFLGIVAVLFGWIEKKEKFVLVGQLIFLVLGFIAWYILVFNLISVPKFEVDSIPKELKALTYFKFVTIFSGINIVALLLQMFNLPLKKATLYISMVIALLLFFMVFHIQQMTV